MSRNPRQRISIEDDNGIRLGRVGFGGVTQPVSLDFVPEGSPGDYVMVHIGFAISLVNQEGAERTRQALEEIGLVAGELPVGARGADVRMVYSPLDALRIARLNSARRVVFLAVGFETTARRGQDRGYARQ